MSWRSDISRPGWLEPAGLVMVEGRGDVSRIGQARVRGRG